MPTRSPHRVSGDDRPVDAAARAPRPDARRDPTHQPASPAPDAAAVVSELHGRFGNGLMQEALWSAPPDGLELLVAGEVVAATSGLDPAGAGLRSNAAVARMLDSSTEQVNLRALASLSTAGGRPLAPEQRARFEQAMGRDLSGVRVHEDAHAAQIAEQINATAFTLGRHVYLGRDAGQPGSPMLDRVLAHELTHVIQSEQGRLPGAEDGPAVSTPTDPAEREAHAAESRVLSALQDVDAPAGPLAEGGPDMLVDAAEPVAHRRALEGLSMVDLLENARGSGVPQAIRDRVSRALYDGEKRPQPDGGAPDTLTRTLTDAADAALRGLEGATGADRGAMSRALSTLSDTREAADGVRDIRAGAGRRFDAQSLIREHLVDTLEGDHQQGADEAGDEAHQGLTTHEQAVDEGITGMADAAVDALLGEEEEQEEQAGGDGAVPGQQPAEAGQPDPDGVQPGHVRDLMPLDAPHAQGVTATSAGPGQAIANLVDEAHKAVEVINQTPFELAEAMARMSQDTPQGRVQDEEAASDSAPPEQQPAETVEQALAAEGTEGESTQEDAWAEGQAEAQAEAVPQELEGEARDELAPPEVVEGEQLEEEAHPQGPEAEADAESLAEPQAPTPPEVAAARTAQQGAPAGSPPPAVQDLATSNEVDGTGVTETPAAAPEQPGVVTPDVGEVALDTSGGGGQDLAEEADLDGALESAQDRLTDAQEEVQSLNAELERLRAEDATARNQPPEAQDEATNERRAREISETETDLEFANNDVERAQADVDEAQAAVDAQKNQGGGGGGGGGAPAAAADALDQAGAAADEALAEGAQDAALGLESDAAAQAEARAARLAELTAQVTETLAAQQSALDQQHASALTALEAQLSAQAAAIEQTAAQAEAQVSQQIAARRAELAAQLDQDAAAVEADEAVAAEQAEVATTQEQDAVTLAAEAEAEVIRVTAQESADQVIQAGHEAAERTRQEAKDHADQVMSEAESRAAAARSVSGPFESEEERRDAEAEGEAEADAIMAEAEAEAQRIIEEGERKAQQQIADAEATAQEILAQGEADAQAAVEAAQAAAEALQASLDGTLGELEAAAEAALTAVAGDETAVNETLDAWEGQALDAIAAQTEAALSALDETRASATEALTQQHAAAAQQLAGQTQALQAQLAASGDVDLAELEAFVGQATADITASVDAASAALHGQLDLARAAFEEALAVNLEAANADLAERTAEITAAAEDAVADAEETLQEEPEHDPNAGLGEGDSLAEDDGAPPAGEGPEPDELVEQGEAQEEVTSTEEQEEEAEEIERPRDQVDRLQDPVFGPDGFDYHGAELVDPEAAQLPPDELNDAIYDQVFADALPESFERLPIQERQYLLEEAQAEAQLAQDRFDALYEQELGLSADVLNQLPYPVREMMEQQAREDALHRLNVGHTGGVGPDVDLSQMSEVEQYNYLHDLILRGGNEFRDGEMEVNILGVRGLEGGVVGDNAANEYNDTIYVLRINEEGQAEVHDFAATTDYGDYDQVLAAGYGGVADGETYPLLMAPGAYSMATQTDPNRDGTNHFLYEGWDPDAPTTSVPDINGNHRVDDDEMAYPHEYQGINSHAGGTGTSVGTWSAGCQVVPRRPSGDTSDRNFYEEYYDVVSADPDFATAERIPYTLVEAWDAPDIAWSQDALDAQSTGDEVPEWDELGGNTPDNDEAIETRDAVVGEDTGDPNAGLGGPPPGAPGYVPPDAPQNVDELFADWENLTIDDVTTLSRLAVGKPQEIDLTGAPTEVFNRALESNDFGTLAATMTSLYARDPAELAAFSAQLPDMLNQMTPEQRAAVGSVMLWQGRQYESSFEGNYTQDPLWQQMATVQRAWGDATAFSGMDPMGRRIDLTASVTGEQYGEFRDDISDLQAQAAAEGQVVWTDMDLPYSMWTRQGNIARYMGVDNVTFVGEDGLRAYAYGPNGEVYDTVTVQEREAATTVYQQGSGVVVLPDGTTAVQTHMGFNKLVEEGEGIRPTGFVNGRGEWVELPTEPVEQSQTDATTDGATQMVMPGFEHLVATENDPDAQAQAEEVQAGNMPLPDPDAPADDPANAPYMQVMLYRAGFANGHYTIGQQTITLGAQELSIRDASAALGLNGLTLSDTTTAITQDPEGVLSTATASGLNINPQGVLTYSHSRNTTGINPETGELDRRGLGFQGQFSYSQGIFNFNGTGTISRGNNSFGIQMGGSTDAYGNNQSGTLGFNVGTGTDKLGVTAGAAITESASTRVVDEGNAQGIAEQTALANSGGDAMLIVGQEHAIRGNLGVNGSNGVVGVGVEVHGEAGTGTYYFTTDGNVQTPDGAPLSTEWATENPEALHDLGEEVGWPNLDAVIDISDVDITQVEVGSGYIFTDFTAAGGQVRGEAYGVGVSLGREGQEYEAVMITRTDGDTVRLSVASMDEATWNAGVDFRSLPLYQYGHTEGNTTLVEFDLDLSTPEGQQAYDIFRDTGALPNSYDQEFVERYDALTAQQAAIEQLQLDAATNPTLYQSELFDAQMEYAVLQEELRGVATLTNNNFLESPEYMEHDPVDGVTYAHRMDQQLEADRHTLLGLASWGRSEVHTIDRLWIDDVLNTAYALQSNELGFGRMVMHGEHGRERGGYNVNPHDGSYELGVFADVPLSDEERDMLARLPEPEDPLARAYLNGAIEGIDPVAQVGVFLTDNHFQVMDAAFEEMRAAGVDPWALVHEEMANASYDATLNTVMSWDDTALNEDILTEAMAPFGDDTVGFLEGVIACPPADFSTLDPAQQQVYLAVYLNQADEMEINPWTALDMVQQVQDEDARNQLLDQISHHIERMNGDDVDGAFQLLELYEDVGEVDPQAAELLRTGVLFTVNDRDMMDKMRAAREDPQSLIDWGLDPNNEGPGEGVWRHRTQDLIDNMNGFQEYGYYEEWLWRESAMDVTTTLMAAEEAGLVDDFMSNLGDSGGTGAYTPTDLLDAMHFEPGYQALVLDVLMRSPTHQAEAMAWAEANGVNVEVVLAGPDQDPAAVAQAAAEGSFDPAHLLSQVHPDDMDDWITLYAEAGIDVAETLQDAAMFRENIDASTVAALAQEDPAALGRLFRDEEQDHGLFSSWSPNTREMTEILAAVDSDPVAAAAFVDAYLQRADDDRWGGDNVENMLKAFKEHGDRTQVLLAMSVLEQAGYEDEVREWRAQNGY
ncbi:MAG: DUF4157 domain-containing protein [Alphaproteobacteria bacterium]|nr:DUF4157 domain-containing protein [Alphaproteobacteria bacterium]